MTLQFPTRAERTGRLRHIASLEAPDSTTISGSLAEWEGWTELALPESGTYVVPGALVPIDIDRERDEGVYVEPNVWMVHAPRPATEP